MNELWVWIVMRVEEGHNYDAEIDEVFYTEQAAINYIDKMQDDLSYDIDDTVYNYSITNHRVK